MERLIALSAKADPSEYSGQAQVIINKLRKLGAVNKPVPISTLVNRTSRRELKVTKTATFENAINHQVRTLAKEKVLRIDRKPTEYLVRLVRMPEEGTLRGYALELLETLKKNGRVMTSTELVKRLKTDTANKNGQMAVWTFHRNKLTKAGYIKLEPIVAALPPKKPVQSVRTRKVSAA